MKLAKTFPAIFGIYWRLHVGGAEAVCNTASDLGMIYSTADSIGR